MAEPEEDRNLEDFFAKKDKTKRTTKSHQHHRVTADDIETRMEKKKKTTKKRTKSSSQDKGERDSTDGVQSSVLDVKIEDDGEWKDVEEEKETNYSDLRIQNLKISSKDEEDKGRQDNGQSGDEGDDRGGRDVPAGPWKSIASVTPATSNVTPRENVAPVETEKETPKTNAGKYVPPGARRAQQGQQTTSTVSSTGFGGRKKKTAPDVNSTDDFPSLAAASSEQGDIMGHEFEKVKSGSRQVEDPSNKQVKLSLGNKYGALEGMESKDIQNGRLLKVHFSSTPIS